MVNCAQIAEYVVKTGVKKSIMLHQINRRIEPSASNAKDHTTPKHVDAGQGEPRVYRRTLAENPVASVTEGKEQPYAEQTTMIAQNNSRADFIAL